MITDRGVSLSNSAQVRRGKPGVESYKSKFGVNSGCFDTTTARSERQSQPPVQFVEFHGSCYNIQTVFLWRGGFESIFWSMREGQGYASDGLYWLSNSEHALRITCMFLEKECIQNIMLTIL